MMHNIHVTILVLHLYNVILMSTFIKLMKILIRMTLFRCNHQNDHDILNVFWSVKAETLHMSSSPLLTGIVDGFDFSRALSGNDHKN